MNDLAVRALAEVRGDRKVVALGVDFWTPLWTMAACCAKLIVVRLWGSSRCVCVDYDAGL